MIHKKLFIAITFLANTLLLQAQTLIVQVKPAGSKTWGYAGIDGKLIIPAQHEKCHPFSSNGYAVVFNAKARQYQFIDMDNKQLVAEQPKFAIKDGLGFAVSGFQDGLALLQLENRKWGYMNAEGKMVIPAIYDDGNDFNGGFAAVKKGKEFLVINKSGVEKAIEVPAIDVRDFSEGLAPIKIADNKMGFINEDGKIAIQPQFEGVGYFKNGIAWAKTFDKKVGYIDKSGKWVIEPQFEAAKDFDKVSGLARVKKSEKWCYVNKDGDIITIDDTLVWGDFSEGLAEGKKGSQKGFYDKTGEWVIEPKFEDVRDFHNGYAAAKLNGKWGLIDKSGTWVIEPTLDSIKDVALVKK
ncbi:WG repeat-containing protein [Fluviicola taffensis]|uniref:KWG Leptospira repeat protein n=1 Tax=Fluviicola taffensis (strain DSM 16823 / NCIMB 13979 / RW262) TaxID=755732 RepID=F2IES5_FLUTR|nr:WG repeat-containing protein [Fluviicola taffensis]AEA45642.1 hypothetical protein Fluta_3673 [Fluviicola taffensis DSM 16823]